MYDKLWAAVQPGLVTGPREGYPVGRSDEQV